MDAVKHLCVNCDLMDQASRTKWDKAVVKAWDDARGPLDQAPAATEEGLPAPTFDTWKSHCTHDQNRRQPVTNPVAGTHLDGPPYLTCREVRKIYPEQCPFFEERKNADSTSDS